MIVEVDRRVCDGHSLKLLIAAGLTWLAHNRERVNHLNVFPVPDGDTGTNMHLTLQRAYDAIAHMDEAHAGTVGERVAQGALRGARGNSGVILSQLLRGFADVVRDHEAFDVAVLRDALGAAVSAGYRAVMEPVEGTILTVARAVHLAVDVHRGDDLADALSVMLTAAEEALADTPNQLKVLKEAGVVDSGGQGLVFILDGMLRLLRGETLEAPDDASMSKSAQNGHAWEQALAPEDTDGYGYDVQFLMYGATTEAEIIRAALRGMGWDVLVVGDGDPLKVHIHTHDPGEPISYGVAHSTYIDDIVVENMQAQYMDYVENRRKGEVLTVREVEGVAVVVVASGEGMERLFREDLHAARVIHGGQTMNPSTEDFLAAVESLPNDEIILLPNNRNILMAAQQAATMAGDKQVRVLPTTTLAQAINAMLGYLDLHGNGDIDAIFAAMEDRMSHVISGEITTATRSTHVNGVQVRQGQLIGIVDGKLVAAGDEIDHVIRDLLRKAGADGRELITLYYGDGVSAQAAESLVESLSGDFAGQTFSLVYGGQPLYPYIVSVE